MTKTLQTFYRKLKEAKEFYLAEIAKHGIESLKTCISKGNSKIGKVLNVSICPIWTCFKCGVLCECQEFCYDIRSCIQYTAVMLARVRNTFIAMNDRERFFNDIEDAMNRRRLHKYMRYHVGGEIPDRDYLERMIKTAVNHPDFTVWTYTKVYQIVNQYIDETGGYDIYIPKRDGKPKAGQMIIMFSEWRGYKMDNPHGLPEFRFVPKSTPADKMPKGYYCPGNCDICKAKLRGCIVGETTNGKEH